MKKMVASAVYRIERNVGSTMEGCFGSTIYYWLDPQPDTNGHYGADAETILGRNFGTGTIVKVTVEVVAEKPFPKRCISPWPGHKSLAHRRSPRAIAGRSRSPART